MSANRSTGTTDRHVSETFGEDIVEAEVLGDVVVSPRPMDPARIDDPAATSRKRRSRWNGFRLPRPPIYLLSLFLLVIVPSAASQIYFAFIASDQFQATARFAVRSANDQASEGSVGAAALSQTSAVSQVSIAGQDAHIVIAYIRSRAIIDDLSKTIDIRAIYSRPEADFWAKLKKDPTIEELTDYWRSMVTVNLDAPSGIVTLYVRAFRSKDALDLSRAITAACEVLVNDVSQRARRDTLERSEAEMRRSEALVRQSLADMRDFRDKVGYIDPVATATMTSKLITDAMAEKIKIENELFVGQKVMSANAPSLNALKTRLDSVNEQIERLKTKLTSGGKDDSPISQSIVRFEELELKRTFSEKLYMLSQDALERARVRAEKQNVYVDVFVPPSLPEEARFPQRVSMSIIIPIALLIIWGIFGLLLSTIEDHRM